MEEVERETEREKRIYISNNSGILGCFTGHTPSLFMTNPVLHSWTISIAGVTNSSSYNQLTDLTACLTTISCYGSFETSGTLLCHLLPDTWHVGACLFVSYPYSRAIVLAIENQKVEESTSSFLQ